VFRDRLVLSRSADGQIAFLTEGAECSDRHVLLGVAVVNSISGRAAAFYAAVWRS
jgi:hypothetical protein